MKKILFVVPFPPPVHGSSMVSQYIKESETIRQTFSCDFVNSSTSRKLEEIGKTKPIKFFRYITSNLTICWKLMTHKYDLCYLAITCHGRGFLKDAPFVLLCKLFGIKVVIHQHNKGMDAYAGKRIYKKLLKQVYKDTIVILLSWKLYDDIKRIVNKEQVLICPNGILDISGAGSSTKPNNTIPKILFLSNLMESKGVWIVLDACKILKEKDYKFSCDFVGGETQWIDSYKFNEEVTKRELNKLVHYLGKKYGNEKKDVFEKADIFIQPTLEDCFPLTLLEACQLRLPIISTDEGGITDIVKDGKNGFIIRKNDAADLANKLIKLFDNKALCKQMGENSYKIYKEKFTQKAFETTLVNNLKTVLEL